MKLGKDKPHNVSKRNASNSWLLDKLKASECSVADLALLLGCSRNRMYYAMSKPSEYFTIYDLMIIATRLNVPFRDVLAWCVGYSASVVNRGVDKYWFE